MRTSEREALIVGVNDFAEHNVALVYKFVYLGEMAHVVDRLPGWHSTVLDIAFADTSLTDLLRVLLRRPHALIIHSDVHHSRLAYRLAKFAKEIEPKIHTLVYGRAAAVIPQFFARWPFDAVHTSGDREDAIASYLISIIGAGGRNGVRGMLLATNNYVESARGKCLPSTDWATPTLAKLPIDAYLEFYRRHKFSKKLEVGVTASKGCPHKCGFCSAYAEEGHTDRRRGPDELISWCSKQTLPDGCIFQLWSPNILCDQNWLKEFSETYRRLTATFLWRGVARTDSINESAIRYAAKASCVEIAIGIENIKASTHRPLKSSMQALEKGSQLAAKYNIRLKGLVMLGVPGQVLEDVHFTRAVLKNLNIDMRFTSYTPFSRLRRLAVEDLDKVLIESFNRRTYYDPKATSFEGRKFFDIILSNGECLDA